MSKKRPSSPQPQTTYGTPIAESPTQFWLPVSNRDSPPRRWLPILSIGLVVMFLLLALGLAAGGALLYYSDWILPGVTLLGVELGSQTTDEAVAALTDQWRNRIIILEADDTTWQVGPGELGIMLDTAVTVTQAHDIGRSSDSLLRWLGAGGRAEITPAWRIDLTVAEVHLETLAAAYEIAPQDAGIALENGRFVATPSVPGRALDVASTRIWLEQYSAQAVLSGHLQLPTIPLPPAVTDVSEIVAAANQLLNTAVSIHAYDPVTDDTVTWVVTPEQWSQWLLPAVDQADSTQFIWTLDETRAQTSLIEQTGSSLADGQFVDGAAMVTAVSDAIKAQKASVNLRIFHHTRQHTVQAGETFASIGRAYGMPYPWIQQANPGVGDALFAGQALTIPSPDALLPLPVVENKRLVVNISQQRMWAYENGDLKWEWPASTGINDSPTSPGVFQVQTHEPNAYAGNWDLWMPYFMGIYQPVPTSGFMNGFHGFPTRDGQNLLWTSALGHQVTYGCVLISTVNAAQLYEWAEEGVVVEIRP